MSTPMYYIYERDQLTVDESKGTCFFFNIICTFTHTRKFIIAATRVYVRDCTLLIYSIRIFLYTLDDAMMACRVGLMEKDYVLKYCMLVEK